MAQSQHHACIPPQAVLVRLARELNVSPDALDDQSTSYTGSPAVVRAATACTTAVRRMEAAGSAMAALASLPKEDEVPLQPRVTYRVSFAGAR